MIRPLALLSILGVMLSGCSFFGSSFQDVARVTSSKVESPYFNLPAENLKDYQKGVWILLAESKTKNWFYDPYSLFEDEEGIVSFNTFVTERAYQEQLQPFNSTSIGPYLQKIDCFSNYQWSEIFYAEHMPKQETYINPLKPTQDWGWIKIKPKTAMAYIRARVCGRKFIDDQNVNYFLYQQGTMPYVKELTPPPRLPIVKSPAERNFGEEWVAQLRIEKVSNDANIVELPKRADSSTPFFYDVVNNQVKVIDPKKNIRQMKLMSYFMDRDFSKRDELLFQANCQARTYSIQAPGKSPKMAELSNLKDDFQNVAFDRACADHGVYMQLESKK